MIKHVVMWKLKEFAEGASRQENALKIKNMLESLNGVIKQIKYMEVGINNNSSNMAFDAVLISAFDDEEGLNTYKNHPQHVKISDFVAKVREGRAVVDYFIE